MSTLASLAAKVKKIEAQLVPEQGIWVIFHYYGCETIHEACTRGRRASVGRDADMLIVLTMYSCAREGTPHSHADEKPWESGNPPDKRW